MSHEQTIAWLSDFQARFGATLRTPLDRSTGTLKPQHAGYDHVTVTSVLPSARHSAEQRLAVYNLQYWCRLFNALHGELRLTTSLIGPWSFNELAARFLVQFPPRTQDLADIAEGFVPWLASEQLADPLPPDGQSEPVPRSALLQAAHIDAALRRVARAPEESAFRPSSEDAGRLARCRLTPSVALSIVVEDWPLLELLGKLPSEVGARAVRLPARHPTPRYAAVLRSENGRRVLPLVPLQARLLTLLLDHPLSAALARLEAESAPSEAPSLAANVQRWLAESTRLGFWTGLEESSA